MNAPHFYRYHCEGTNGRIKTDDLWEASFWASLGYVIHDYSRMLAQSRTDKTT